MGNYEIKIHGEKVKVSLVDNTAIVGAKIDELKSLLQTQQNPIVGLDFNNYGSFMLSVFKAILTPCALGLNFERARSCGTDSSALGDLRFILPAYQYLKIPFLRML
ncbi:hypothetical protein CFP56_020625 [Quercus suber]|uniref:Uncharacterized protein n=1 Tax=Quercus suber TaxID=58331 RepID=A0AAW0KH78_QUESU